MFHEISYFSLFGIPTIVYLGITTLTLFMITALLALLVRRRITKTPLAWHYRFAYLSLSIGIIHGSLGLLAYI